MKISGKTALFISAAISLVFAAGLLICFFADGSAVHCRKVSEKALMTGTDEDRPYEDYLEYLPGRPLDINSASAEQLQKLDGIGEELSKRIVYHRQFAGPFLQIEDIMQVDGISESLFAGIEHLITVGEVYENTGS